jgi:aspartyl-tRNA synthetase
LKHPGSYRNMLCGEPRVKDAGQKITVCGWISHKREHGEQLVFVDVRDFSGIIQAIVDASVVLRPEYVVKITGTLRRRPAGSENEEIPTGDVELVDCEVEVLSEAETPTFVLDKVGEVEESTRLTYRYLDLRTKRMQRNLRFRSEVYQVLRRSLVDEDFCEIDTPLLWVPTPEGAREFVVPSRINKSKFYALPQSPQIAKQLLMVSGFDRYFQIARCLRDEDLRADRQFEFSQLDLEASFVTESDIRYFVQSAVENTMRELLPEAPFDFKEMSYREAIEKYGTDKPDIRFGFEIKDITDIVRDSGIKAMSGEYTKVIVVPRDHQLSRSKLDHLVEFAKKLGASGLLWLKAELKGNEAVLDSPISKYLSEDLVKLLTAQLEVTKGDTILAVSGDYKTTCSTLGSVRSWLIEDLNLKSEQFKYVWVTQFPLFDNDASTGEIIPAHHPFTMPDPEDICFLDTEPLKVRAQAYDLVLNGWELGSGSIRIYQKELQEKIFQLLKLTSQEIESKFGFLIKAFGYGVPPHGGFAIGLDRFIALLLGEKNIREAIAFPKTQSGIDLMTGAPKELGKEKLRELNLRPIE